MERVRQILLMLAVAVPAHMTEELVFRSGQGTVVVLALVGASGLLLACGLLARGTARLAASAALGVLCLAQFHHVVTTFVFGVYTPGVVTAVPIVVFGPILIHEAAAEYRRSRIRWADVEPAYQTW